MTRIRLTLSASSIRHIVGGGQHPANEDGVVNRITSTTDGTFALELGDTIESAKGAAKRLAALLQTVADAPCVYRLTVVMSKEAGCSAFSFEIWRAPYAPALVWQALLQAIAALDYVCRELPLADEDHNGNVTNWDVAEVIVR